MKQTTNLINSEIENYVFSESIISSSNNFKLPTILILDSGVGGLSIYYKVKQILPSAYYIYVFDNEAFPYGKKKEYFIVNRVITIINAILRLHEINIIIIACNTASIISLPILRKTFSYPTIIGVVPDIKLASRITRNGIVGLLATHVTIQHDYTNKLISQLANDCKVLKLALSELVEIAEAKLQGKVISISFIHKLLYPWLKIKDPPDTIVLGCTHFSLLSQELKLVFSRKTCLIDSNLAIAHRAFRLLNHGTSTSILNNQIKLNKAYCLSMTTSILSLLPTLIRYGFKSFEKLNI